MSTNFYNNLIDDIVRKIVIDNNDHTARGDNNLSDQEKNILKSLGIDVDNFNVANYTGTLNKFGANKAQEREQILAQLKGFIEKILELLPEGANITSEFNTLIGEAHNANSLQDFFKVFTNKIEELQTNKNKSDANKELERLILVNQSYNEDRFLKILDYERLIKLLPNCDNVSNISYLKTELNGTTKTTIIFNYNNKPYTFSINEDIDTSGVNATESAVSNTSVEEFEKIIQSFAKGELHQGDLVAKLEPFGFTRDQIEKATKYNYQNDGYEITLKYGDKTYTFNCNIGGANDGTSDTNLGETYTLINPSEIKNQGLSDEQINKYFVKAVVVNGQVQYYAKNKNAWQSLGLKTTDNISALKAAVKRSEELQHITDLVNEVITNLISEHQLTPEEAQQLRDYLHGDSLKSRLEGMIGKTDDQIKNSVTSLGETYITGTIRKAGTKGSGSVDTSSLTDAQVSTINSICNTIASAVGINSSDLIERVKAAAVEFASATDFEAKVQEKALDIAQGILKEINTQSTDNGDLDELISNFIDGGNHSPGVLSELKKYHDNGDIKLSIEKDGSGSYYAVSITRDGSILGTELVDEQTLKDAGFNIQSGIVDLTSPTQTNISDSEKSEILLEICRGFMTNGVSVDGNNKGKLTFEQAMDVYSKVKNHDSYQMKYNKIETFKNAISTIANDFAVASIQAGTRTENDATAEQIDEAAKNLTSWGGESSYNLEGILPATTDRHDSYTLTSKDFKELYNNDYIVRLHISMDSSESWEDAGNTINRQLNQLGNIITSALGTTNLFDKDILEKAKNNIIKKYCDAKFNYGVNDDDDGTDGYDLTNNLAWRMKNDRSGTGHRVVGTRDDDGSDSWVWGVRFKDIVDDIIAEYKRLAGY